MANVMQQGAQWLVDQLAKLDKSAAAEKATLAKNRARVNALRAGAERIADAKKRTASRAAVAKLDARQRQVESVFSGFVARYAKLKAQAIAWMKAHGVLAGRGLGALPLVPIGMAAVVLTTAGLVAWAHEANKAQNTAVAMEERAQKALFAGQITPEQFAADAAARHQAAEDAMPKSDPLGLTNAAKALVPVGLLVVGIMVLPTVLQMLNGRRDSRGISNPRRRRARRLRRSRRRRSRFAWEGA